MGSGVLDCRSRLRSLESHRSPSGGLVALRGSRSLLFEVFGARQLVLLEVTQI